MLAGKYFHPRGRLCGTDHLAVAGHSANSQRMERVARNGPSSLLFEHDPFSLSHPRDREWPIERAYSLATCSYNQSGWLASWDTVQVLISLLTHLPFSFPFDLSYKLGCQPVCRLLRGGDRLYHLYTRDDVDFDSQEFTSIPWHGGNGSFDPFDFDSSIFFLFFILDDLWCLSWFFFVIGGLLLWGWRRLKMV